MANEFIIQKWFDNDLDAPAGGGTSNISAGLLSTSVMAALLVANGALSAAMASTSVMQSNLTGLGALSAAAESTSVMQANGQALAQGAAGIVSTSVFQANLSGLGALSAAPNTTSVFQAQLVGSGALSAALESTSILQGLVENATNTSDIPASMVSTSVMQAQLTGDGALASALESTSILQAQLTGTGALSAAAESTSVLQASLGGLGALNASMVSTTILQGNLEAAPAGSMSAAMIATSIMQADISYTFTEIPSGATPGRRERHPSRTAQATPPDTARWRSLNLPSQVRGETDEQKRARRIAQGIEAPEAAAPEVPARNKPSRNWAAELAEIQANLAATQAQIDRYRSIVEQSERARQTARDIESQRVLDQENLEAQMRAAAQLAMAIEQHRLLLAEIEALDIAFIAVTLSEL